MSMYYLYVYAMTLDKEPRAAVSRAGASGRIMFMTEDVSSGV